MRLQLLLTPNTQPVPFDHLHHLTGAIHKWLGPNNDLHDGLSLYSFGWLRGGELRKNGLAFSKGASWNLSFFNDINARHLLKGLLDEPSVAFGMTVQEVREIAPPDFQARHYFQTDGSAVIIRQKRTDGTREYMLWDNPATDEVLTQSFRRKLSAAGFSGSDLDVRVAFDRNYQKARTRKITIKGTHHRGSECPIILESTPDMHYFAWTVGLGELTGSGFGALR
jgi:CRISPR-associated endoribonuclease Cas6